MMFQQQQQYQLQRQDQALLGELNGAAMGHSYGGNSLDSDFPSQAGLKSTNHQPVDADNCLEQLCSKDEEWLQPLGA